MSDKTFSLQIDGMHCGGCVRRVQSALEKLSGVSVDEVVVGKAGGTFDPAETEAEAIAEAVTKAGYPARLVEGSVESGAHD